MVNWPKISILAYPQDPLKHPTTPKKSYYTLEGVLLEEESVEYKPDGVMLLITIFCWVFPFIILFSQPFDSNSCMKKSGNFVNFGQGIPGKVRENHFLQVLTTMMTLVLLLFLDCLK